MQRNIDEMIQRGLIVGNPVNIDLSSTDYTVSATLKTNAISSVDGTVIFVDIVNDAGSTVSNVPIPAPGVVLVDSHISKIYKSGTDCSTTNSIVLWTLP